VTHTRQIFDTLVILVAILVIWQGLYLVVGDTALTAPVSTFGFLFETITTRRFLENVVATLETFALALLLSYLVGMIVGVWMGAHRISGEVGEPILIAFSSLPKITLYPVVLLIFGLGLSSKVAFGVMHGMLPVSLLTMNAIRNVPPVYLKSARTLHLSPRQIVTHIILPATLPEVVSGLRIGFTVTLLGVLLGEMFASKRGLGFLIINAIDQVQPQMMLTVAILVFTFAALSNAGLLWLEHRLKA
jgi:NitT/TauT family transport system permease protein